MTDELLPYYQRELTYIRKLGAEFARQHPKIAGRLRLREEETQDPHVERLIEAFAFLTARIRHKLDDEFPEIAQALLDVLYPHYLAPIPSMAVVRMTLDRSQTELTSPLCLPVGTSLDAATADGDICRFRTCYPVRLWPIEVTSAELTGPPFAAPPLRFTQPVRSVLRVRLSHYSREATFAQLELDGLRFFLQAQPQQAYPLYELILNHTLGLAVANGDDRDAAVRLPAAALQPVGFGVDEGMLPYPKRSFLGYRLLTEYFVFPQKFLFFDVSWKGIRQEQRERLGHQMDLFVYLSRQIPELEQQVSAQTLVLGCTPVVNLFPQRAEPIRLTHRETEYRVIPDSRRPLATEVYSVDRVVATAPTGETVEYQPFFSFKHAGEAAEQTRFWHAVRRPSPAQTTPPDHGTEVYLSLVDLGFSPETDDGWVVDVETTCLNRDLPQRLPFGGGQPHMELVDGEPIASIECLTSPTPTYRVPLRHGMLWRLISHLSVNHLSLCDGEEGAEALREILALYDFAESEETRAMIEGVRSIATRRVVGRTGGGVSGGLCRGLEVSITFDETRFVGESVFLFASVLERFLGLYCSINSFTQLIARTSKQERNLKQWPPRAGERVLL